MIYNVTLCANRTDATQDGYGQWYQAYDDDGNFAGAWFPSDSPADKSLVVPVLTMRVVSRCAIKACRKLRHWRDEGLDAAWLLLPNNDDSREWPVYNVTI